MPSDPIRLADYRQARELRRAATRMVVERPPYTLQAEAGADCVELGLPGAQLMFTVDDALGFAAAIIKMARHARGSK